MNQQKEAIKKSMLNKAQCGSNFACHFLYEMTQSVNNLKLCLLFQLETETPHPALAFKPWIQNATNKTDLFKAFLVCDGPWIGLWVYQEPNCIFLVHPHLYSEMRERGSGVP